MYCLTHGCNERSLCQKCIIEHKPDHLATIVPLKGTSIFLTAEFTSQNNHVPTLLSRELSSIRSRIFTLHNQIIAVKDSRKIEFENFHSSLKQLSQAALESFLKEGLEYIQKFYSQYDQRISEILYNLQSNIETLNPYTSESGAKIDSKKLNFIVAYQERMFREVIPAFQEQASALAKEIVKCELYLAPEPSYQQFNQSLRS